MRAITAGLATLGLVALVGCNNSPPGGSGGARGTGTGGTTARAATFNIHAPAMSTTVKQGETKEVKVKLDRGKDFHDDVTLKFEVAASGKGIKVDPAEKVVHAGDPEDVTVNVTADKDAAIGEHDINVSGAAKTGGSTTAVAFKIKIDKGG